MIAAIALTRVGRARRDQQVLLADGSTGGLIERQAELRRDLAGLCARLDALDARVAHVDGRVEEALRTAFRDLALVRYDAFGEQGGHQSWSLALTDAERTGVVVTGLLRREETRVYVKQLTGGVADVELSADEERAVARAGRSRAAA